MLFESFADKLDAQLCLELLVLRDLFVLQIELPSVGFDQGGPLDGLLARAELQLRSDLVTLLLDVADGFGNREPSCRT